MRHYLLLSLLVLGCAGEPFVLSTISSDNAESAEQATVGDTVTVLLGFNNTVTSLTGTVAGSNEFEIDIGFCDELSDDTRACRCTGKGCHCTVTMDFVTNTQTYAKVETELLDFGDGGHEFINLHFGGLDEEPAVCVPTGGYCSQSNYTCFEEADITSDLRNYGSSTIDIAVDGSYRIGTTCPSSTGHHLVAYITFSTCTQLASFIEIQYEVTNTTMEGLLALNLDYTTSDGISGTVNTDTLTTSNVTVDITPPSIVSLETYSTNSDDPSVAVVGDFVYINVTFSETLVDSPGAVEFGIGSSGQTYLSGLSSEVIQNSPTSFTFYAEVMGGWDEDNIFVVTALDPAGNIVFATQDHTTDGSSVTINHPDVVAITSEGHADGDYTYDPMIFTFHTTDPLFPFEAIDFNSTLCLNAQFGGAAPEYTLSCDQNFGATVEVDIKPNYNGTGGAEFLSGGSFSLMSDESHHTLYETCVCDSYGMTDCSCMVQFDINPNFIIRSAEVELVVAGVGHGDLAFDILSENSGFAEFYDTLSTCTGTCGTTQVCETDYDVKPMIFASSANSIWINMYRVDSNCANDASTLQARLRLEMKVVDTCNAGCAAGAKCTAAIDTRFCECPFGYGATDPYDSSQTCEYVGCGMDNPDFVDDQGHTCEDYDQNECINEIFGFGESDRDDHRNLRKNCPVTCGSCPPAPGESNYRFASAPSGNEVSAGLVEVFSNGAWGGFLFGDTDAEADGMCQALGFASGIASRSGDRVGNLKENLDKVILYDGVRCEGNFTDISECVHFRDVDSGDNVVASLINCHDECVKVEDAPTVFFYGDYSESLHCDELSPMVCLRRANPSEADPNDLMNFYWNQNYDPDGRGGEGGVRYFAEAPPDNLEDLDLSQFTVHIDNTICQGYCPGRLHEPFSMMVEDSGDIYEVNMDSWNENDLRFSWSRTLRYTCRPDSYPIPTPEPHDGDVIQTQITLTGISEDLLASTPGLLDVILQAIADELGLDVGSLSASSISAGSRKQDSVSIGLTIEGETGGLEDVNDDLTNLDADAFVAALNDAFAAAGFDFVSVSGVSVDFVAYIPSADHLECADADLSAVTFTKTRDQDPSVAAGQDRINDDVHLTQASRGHLYNAAVENSASSPAAPTGTYWALGSTATGNTYGFFDDLCAAVDGCRNLEGQTASLWLAGSNNFYDVEFINWPTGQSSETNTDLVYRRTHVKDCTLVTPTPAPTAEPTEEPGDGGSDLSDGEIAGLVIGVMLAGSMLAACIVCACVRKNEKFANAVTGSEMSKVKSETEGKAL